MEIDLEQAGTDLETLAATLRSQVCVVGGGIAGLLVAQRLAGAGVGVTMLEAGGLARDFAEHADPFGSELRRRPHASTRQGRVRALGGTSITWGGQLLPLAEDSNWPLDAAELRRYEAEADVLFGVDRLPYAADQYFASTGMPVPALAMAAASWRPRLSKFVPFGRRNLAASIGRELVRHPGVRVVLHAGAVELVSAAGGRVLAVLVQTRGGGRLRVEAEQFVLAAGTVESCRMLLVSRSVMPEGLGNEHDQVGRNFHDHLTLTAAVFTGASRAAVVRELRPWVFSSAEGSTLHSLKLETTPKLRAGLGVNAAMAHVTVEEPDASGIAAVRSLLRARQQGSFARNFRTHVAQIPAALVEAARLGWSARVWHRRYVSPQAEVRLQINMAQDTPSTSRILLSDDSDARGMPRAVVDWSVTEAELERLRRFAVCVRERLRADRMDEDVVWEMALFGQGSDCNEELLRVVDDARHAMGGACMGADPRTSVVDPELRVHGFENLSVASAAVFPDGSAQLPTLTLAALCLRLADRLQGQLA